MDEYQLGKDIQTMKDSLSRLTERIDLIEKKLEKKNCQGSWSVIESNKRVEGDREVEGKSGPYIWLSWGTIYHGDCKLTNAVLTLYSDGTATFSAWVVSSDTQWYVGDQWHASFTVLDSANNPIVSLSNIDSPWMDSDDVGVTMESNWNGHIFPEIQSGFDRIWSATMRHRC